jgi:dTDP-glucose 4,6-dehydratase
MDTIAVIGSNSFSGGDFVDLLLEQGRHRVLGISRSPEKGPIFLRYKARPASELEGFSFHQVDLNQDMQKLFSLLDRARPRYIVNFAAQSEVAPSWEHPEQWARTNVAAVAEIANYLRRQDWLERYVHISSPEVYGTTEGLVREDAPLNPSTPYAASKAGGDLMLETFVRNFDLPVTFIRGTNVYGAHQQLFKIIPRSVIYLKSGRPIELHGGGTAVKSYINIRDVSRGELAAMQADIRGILHLSPDVGVAVRDVVRTICERLGKDFEASTRVVEERLGQDRAYVIDSSRAREALGWTPEIGLEEGISEVVDWAERHWEEIQRRPLEYVHQP